MVNCYHSNRIDTALWGISVWTHACTCTCVRAQVPGALRTRGCLTRLGVPLGPTKGHHSVHPHFTKFQNAQSGAHAHFRPRKVGTGCKGGTLVLSGVAKIPQPGRGFLGGPVAPVRPPEWPLWPIIISSDNQDPKLGLFPRGLGPLSLTDRTHSRGATVGAGSRTRPLPQAESVVPGVEGAPSRRWVSGCWRRSLGRGTGASHDRRHRPSTPDHDPAT